MSEVVILAVAVGFNGGFLFLGGILAIHGSVNVRKRS